MRRTDQRRAAVWALYQSDLLGRPLGETLPRDVHGFTFALAEQVREHQPEIDALIARYASGWSLDRIAPVERSILRVALLELLYSTGARISEAVGLDVDDIDTHARSVLLRGKGGKQRLVPIGRPAVQALDAYMVRGRSELARRGRGTPAIFLNARGGRLSRQSAWQVLQDAADRAGITSGVSPHTLRHSFATHLLDGGADVRVVQELLGHASVTTTQIYTMVTVHTLREVWAEAHPRAH